MNILVEGKVKEEPIIRFSCKECGCVFEAEYGEYRGPTYAEAMHDDISAVCECPFCHNNVYAYD